MKDNKIRLQKHLAASGIASRRKAEELIMAGKVRVNGKVHKTFRLINTADYFHILFVLDTVAYIFTHFSASAYKQDLYHFVSHPLFVEKIKYIREYVFELHVFFSKNIFGGHIYPPCFFIMKLSTYSCNNCIIAMKK